MPKRKKITVLIASIQKNSSSYRLMKKLAELNEGIIEMIIFENLNELPLCGAVLKNDYEVAMITAFKSAISNADGIIVCTADYNFSIPNNLKNAINWCLDTDEFSNKPIWHITAKIIRERAHSQLKELMESTGAKLLKASTFFLKAKRDQNGDLSYVDAVERVKDFLKLITEWKKSKK
jgi:chromate reductase, NAD(P)H dehydrogenase (quinone)